MSLLSRSVKRAITGSLALVGLKVTRVDRDSAHDPDDVATFIPFERTMEAARQAGLSVGDYVDTVMNKVPGSSQNTIDKMASAGMFAAPLETIVEVGPGTGRYLEKTLKAAHPSRYEIYETAGPWASYLVREYKAVLQPTDGFSLAATADRSVDLVHAHMVFSTVPFMVTICYWREMLRVVKPGGWVAFDVVTEECLSADSVQTWATSGIRNGSYPAVMPRLVAEEFFTNNGFRSVGSFVVPMKPGTTDLLVFRREI